MKQTYYKAGDYNAVCDICGFRFKASQLKKNWKNEMVCDADFELRHPQEFVRVRPEKIAAPWVRPEVDILIAPTCYLWDQTGYTGLGSCGCMQAGQTRNMTSQQVYALLNQPPPA